MCRHPHISHYHRICLDRKVSGFLRISMPGEDWDVVWCDQSHCCRMVSGAQKKPSTNYLFSLDSSRGEHCLHLWQRVLNPWILIPALETRICALWCTDPTFCRMKHWWNMQNWSHCMSFRSNRTTRIESQVAGSGPVQNNQGAGGAGRCRLAVDGSCLVLVSLETSYIAIICNCQLLYKLFCINHWWKSVNSGLRSVLFALMILRGRGSCSFYVSLQGVWQSPKALQQNRGWDIHKHIKHIKADQRTILKGRNR